LYEVALSPGAGGPRRAYVRELSGRDELDVDLTTPTGATRLVASLLVDADGTSVAPSDVWTLTLSDRDRILALIYAAGFGDHVESQLNCEACNKEFEVRFSLVELVASLHEPKNGPALGPDSDGIYALADGRRFRLPTTEDERAVAGMDSARAVAELLVRCTVAGQASENPEELQNAMEQLGPILSLDIPTKCAFCSVEQLVRFDLSSYLDSALRKERALLVREVHRLATAYHWSFDEILGLPRSQRRLFVGLAEAERHVHAGVVW
jgi:hypothetical protein